jgi:LysR family hydrogen peroxide-inducible transcriptional activator
MPTITQLEYIVAVDTLRHFGLAAKECYVTQPTLSMQIKKAEEDLGVIIFDRSKQPVLPTDVGKELILQARNVLREVQALHQIIDDFQNVVAGHLRVGIIPTISTYLLPLFVGDFVRQNPKVKLEVQELQSKEIIQALKNDVLDVGIVTTPIQESGIKELPLYYEEIKLYVHPENRYAKKKVVDNEELSSQHLWTLSEGNCFRSQTINLCADEKEQANLPFQFESGSLESLQRLVDREGGFTLLPELAIPSTTTNTRSIINPTPVREVSLVYVRNFAKTKLLDILAKEIIRTVPNHMRSIDKHKVVQWT